jgi:aspartyl protease family protein
MGLQDRDYYRGSYQRTPQENHSHNLHVPRSRIAKINSAGLRYLLYPVLTIAALWYGADYLLDKIKNGKLLEPAYGLPANQKPLDLTPGSISLKTDRQGHFRGTVLVNNIPMPFLIDTGATTTVIPAKMARAASLPLGRFVQASTAGGKVVDRVTRINSLKIGNAEIRNLEAHINEHLDEVLMGMNTLKYFHMTQSGNTLTLVADNPQVHRAANAPTATFDTFPMQQPIAEPVKIKKTVTCNEHQVCITKYSDH